MRGRTILLVEDNVADAGLFREALRQTRFALKHVCDGDEALAVLRAETLELPDWVVVDCTLPGTTGCEFLALIKADPRTKPIPVIMLTTSGSPADRLQCLKLGAVDYVVKPFAMNEYIAAVKRIAATLTA